MIEFEDAYSGQRLRDVRALFQEYAESLGVDLSFQNFDAELAELPKGYEPPEGALVIALFEGEVAGCVAMRRCAAGVAEMKRLYIRQAYRGHGIGRALAQAVIAKARDADYATIRLDTLPSMESARALYKVLGFKEIEAYRYNPIEGTAYLELDLRD
ncbi:MAG: GNAT family N-acetyltransferase [Pseudomonadota bacterium]